jgi:hypothetical protein
LERGWLKSWDVFAPQAGGVSWEFSLDAPVATVGVVVAATMKPGPAVLTNIRFGDGREIAASGGPAELADALREAGADPAAPANGAAKAPKVAATVKRPTPCCPRCLPGAVEPASEVLLSFLDAEQHEQWARTRTLVVEGGITGARYLLAHRNTGVAARIGRICYDLDDKVVVHFHDNGVPPEEEVLAAMLILKHREQWLRNEATVFGRVSAPVLKNPFGGVSDGMMDSGLMHAIGEVFVPPPPPRRRRRNALFAD